MNFRHCENKRILVEYLQHDKHIVNQFALRFNRNIKLFAFLYHKLRLD